MNKLILSLALASVALALGATPSSLQAKRARNELLAERFGPSCAELRVFFRLDADGEMPSCVLRSYCPNCKEYHVRSVQSYLEKERPLSVSAFALSPTRFLAEDLHLRAAWIDRMELVFGGKSYAAKRVARYPGEAAVEIETEGPVAGVRPLVFSKARDFASDAEGVFFFSTKEKGLAVSGTRPNGSADLVRYGDVGKCFFSAVANTIAVNASNEAASVVFRDKIAADGSAFRAPVEWTREPIDAFERRWEALQDGFTECLVPLYVHLDDEENRKDGYSRRYRSYRDDSSSTDLDLVGLVLPEGEILAPLHLDASKMSEIDKIEAILPNGERLPLDFVGALSDVKLAVFRFADGKIPPVLKPATFDARRLETHFLDPAFVLTANNYNGKSKVKLAYAPLTEFEVGRGGECVPDFPSSYGSDANRLSLLVFPDGSVCGLAARHRQAERYSSSMEFVTAAKLTTALADRAFDPQFALRKGKDRVRIAWIGVETQRLTEELAREKRAMAQLASARTSGALVTRVWTNSPAAKAGIAAGDILLTARLARSHATRDLEDSDTSDGFDWSAFFSMAGEIGEEDFGDYLGNLSPWPNVERGVNSTFTAFGIGKRVVVAYVRNGERHEAELTLEQAPVHYQTAKRVKNKELGIIVSDMTFEVRGYFKFDEKAPGVVVVKVQPGNPAAIGGLRPLEIITHVNNEPVTGAKDFARKVKGQKNLTFSVRRLAATRVVRIELKK